MELLLSILIILALMLFMVVYQSRKDKPPLKIYASRFWLLFIIIINYFKDIGIYSAQKFRQINWDLTLERTSEIKPLQQKETSKNLNLPQFKPKTENTKKEHSLSEAWRR